MTILKMTTGQGIDHLAETETHHTEAEEILVEILEENHETIIGMTIEEKIIENRGIEIELEVETIAGICTEKEKTLERTIHEVESIVEIGVGQDNHAPN